MSVEKWINPVSCDINLEYIYMYIKILHRDGYFLKREKLFLSFFFIRGIKLKKRKKNFDDERKEKRYSSYLKNIYFGRLLE